jgi:putative ABC transport system substrate-binding protein
MKKFSKLLSVLFAVMFILFAFAGCSQGKKEINVGVIQFGSHPSLDNCYTGIEAALKESGLEITIDRQDGNFDSATCDTIAKNMVSKNYDMIIAIATPAAVSAYSAAANTDIPVIFCAVSDPVAAGLVESLEAPKGNSTGTSDVLDFSAQLNLIKALQPDAAKIGVLYTTSEANSVSQLAQLKAIAPDFGVEIIDQGVQGASDIPQAAASLVAKVDCITNFTDNNVVNNLSILLEQANAAKIPVYGSEEEQVLNGCLASVGIDYIKLGNVTGQMALDVLGGANASEMAVRQITDTTPVVNTDVLAALGLKLPDDYNNATLVTPKPE